MTTRPRPSAPSRPTMPLRLNRSGPVVTVVIGTLATFGVLMSTAVAAVVVGGLLQWDRGVAHALDNAMPLVVLFLGMVLSGRVAVDVAGRWALASVLGAAIIVAGLGLQVSKTNEAHGDAVEPWQVAVATTIVLVVVGPTAWLVKRQRARRTVQT